MLKKENFLFFAVIGLAIAYGFISILVFITRGKQGNLLSKKIALSAMIIAFTAILSTGPIAKAQDTPTPTDGDLVVIPVYAAPLTESPALTDTAEPLPDYATPSPTPVYGTPPSTSEPVPTVIYAAPEIGDVNMDLRIDMIDSLLIAQYYVGLVPDPNMDYGAPVAFYPEYADVDKSTKIDILDALLVSQKYVGIIDEFPDNSPSKE